MKRFWIWSVVLFFSVKTLSAADVVLDAVGKLQHFRQNTAGAPVVPTTNGFSFQAFVVASTNDVVTGAVVRLPNNTTRTLARESPADWRFEQYFNTLAALDAAYPHNDGFGSTYQMRMQTVNDGPRTNNCNYLFLSSTYPPTPQVQNWSAAQQIDHTRSFTLQWNNLGGAAADLVQVLVEQNVTNIFYTSPLPFTANWLNGASNAVTIPGYALPPGTNLTGHILVVHVAGIPDTNSYAVGAALLGKETVFPIRTRPVPASPMLILLSRTNSQTQLLLTTTETNRTYQIQATENWTNWQTLVTTNLTTAGNFFFRDTQGTNLMRRSYRARVGN